MVNPADPNRKRRAVDGLEGERNKMLCVRSYKYEKPTMYILGDPRVRQESDTAEELKSHGELLTDKEIRATNAIDEFTNFWDQNGDGTISIKRIPPAEDANQMIERLNRHACEELVIVVYCGQARGKESEYRWLYSRGPSGGFDAWSLLHAARKCEPDVMFIIDAFLQSRLPSLKRNSGTGSTEIFFAPAKYSDPETGEPKIFDPGHVMEALVRIMERYIRIVFHNEIPTDNAFRPDQRFFERMQNNLQSINQISVGDRLMYSNIQHHFYNRSYGSQETEVARFKFDLEKLKATGKLNFYSEENQGPGQHKPKCISNTLLQWELAQWSQLLGTNGQLEDEWGDSKQSLESLRQLVDSFCQPGLYSLLKYIGDYSEVKITGSSTGQSDLKIVRNDNIWTTYKGGASVSSHHGQFPNHMHYSSFTERFDGTG